MTSQEAAYLAGLIDGEGCFTNANAANTPCLKLRMTHEETVRYCEALTRVGRVYHQRETRRDGWNDTWYWVVIRRADLEPLLKRIRRYLITRREQADAILGYYKKGAPWRT